MYKLVRLLVLLAVLVTGASAAAILRYDYNFDPARNNSVDLIVPRFDVPWGNLHNIEFLITLTSVEAGGTVTNNIQIPGTYDYTAEIAYNLALFGTTPYLSLLAISEQTLTPIPLQFQLSSLGRRDISASTTNVMQQRSYSDAAILNYFSGVGADVPLRLSAYPTLDVRGPGLEVQNPYIDLAGTASVVFTYDTPEPGTLVLLGSSLIGLALLGRKLRVNG